jgi:uncharacterized Zn finger protein (UPF0148 family)
MVCKGICSRHKAMRPSNGGNRYLLGQKRCQVCQIFIYWQGSSYCPCCGYKLRTKPRNSKFKLTLINKNNNKQQAESITDLLD